MSRLLEGYGWNAHREYVRCGIEDCLLDSKHSGEHITIPPESWFWSKGHKTLHIPNWNRVLPEVIRRGWGASIVSTFSDTRLHGMSICDHGANLSISLKSVVPEEFKKNGVMAAREIFICRSCKKKYDAQAV